MSSCLSIYLQNHALTYHLVSFAPETNDILQAAALQRAAIGQLQQGVHHPVYVISLQQKEISRVPA